MVPLGLDVLRHRVGDDLDLRPDELAHPAVEVGDEARVHLPPTPLRKRLVLILDRFRDVPLDLGVRRPERVERLEGAVAGGVGADA